MIPLESYAYDDFMENNKSRKHGSSKGLKDGQRPEGCPSSSRLLRNGAEVERIMELVESNWKWEGREYENNALAESPKLDSIGIVYLSPFATDAEIRAYWIGRMVQTGNLRLLARIRENEDKKEA